MELLERSAEIALLDERLAAVCGSGRGRLVLIAGEAGVGKSALVRAFCARHAGVPSLAGACEALFTPRPLGPLLDLAAQLDRGFAAIAERGPAPADLLAALGRELHGPHILVLEDLHWADEATLDVLRLLGRRVAGLPALVVATYRDDELDRMHPLRVVLGELGGGLLDRMTVGPLSPAAVQLLSDDRGIDVAQLHERTGGNAFFVTEVLAAQDADEIPDTVRDAVHARAARLDAGARRLLEAVAVVPPRAELWLLEVLAGADLPRLEACLASGMLRAHGNAVGFRHEIGRVTIEEALAPDRRVGLHRAALAALIGRADPARLAHHAEAAEQGEAVLEHATAAGERAARLGAHREAAVQFARALRHAGPLAPADRAALLERRAYECYLTERIPEAIEARELARDAYRAAGDRLREGDTERWLSRLAWFDGDGSRAQQSALRAVALLEALPAGRELAMAYSNVAQLRMLGYDIAAAVDWGGRAIELAERLGEQEILVHALNNVGASQLCHEQPGGRENLERSLALALAAGLEEHVARAYTNLGSIAVEKRENATALGHLDAGIAYCREHHLDAWDSYMSGWRSRAQLQQGRWDAAAETATAVAEAPSASLPSRITPLAVIGTLRARRGDPDPWAPLDEAQALARRTGELQRLAPVAAARAEARWLAGKPRRVAAETDAVLELLLAIDDPWNTGDLCVWRHRAGIADARPANVAPPFAAELAGDTGTAATLWTQLGCPYEAALARAAGDDDDDLRAGLAELQRLGARTAAALVARRLRERGARDVRRGPRTSTQANPAGLTARQLEVLGLLAQGERNAEIAARLFLSEKTVDHHVSAILRKLGVRTRGQAGAAAARLGIAQR